MEKMNGDMLEMILNSESSRLTERITKFMIYQVQTFLAESSLKYSAVKPLIEVKDTPKEDKSPNKGQAESTLVCTLNRKSPLKEDNLSTYIHVQSTWSQMCPY